MAADIERVPASTDVLLELCNHFGWPRVDHPEHLEAAERAFTEMTQRNFFVCAIMNNDAIWHIRSAGRLAKHVPTVVGEPPYVRHLIGFPQAIFKAAVKDAVIEPLAQFDETDGYAGTM